MTLILLMERILHQLIGTLSVYPMIYKVLYIPGGDRRISSINSSSVLQFDGQSNFCVTSFPILSTIQIQIVVMMFQVRLHGPIKF